MTTHVDTDCRLDVDTGSIPVASTIFIAAIVHGTLLIVTVFFRKMTTYQSISIDASLGQWMSQLLFQPSTGFLIEFPNHTVIGIETRHRFDQSESFGKPM